MTKLLWFLDLKKMNALLWQYQKEHLRERVRRLQVLHCPLLSTNDQYCPRLDRTLEVSPLMWRPGPMREAAA